MSDSTISNNAAEGGKGAPGLEGTRGVDGANGTEGAEGKVGAKGATDAKGADGSFGVTAAVLNGKKEVLAVRAAKVTRAKTAAQAATAALAGSSIGPLLFRPGGKTWGTSKEIITASPGDARRGNPLVTPSRPEQNGIIVMRDGNIY